MSDTQGLSHADIAEMPGLWWNPGVPIAGQGEATGQMKQCQVFTIPAEGECDGEGVKPAAGWHLSSMLAISQKDSRAHGMT
jgi:hypothetical protein